MPADWNGETLGQLAVVRARIGWRGLAASEYTEDGPYLIAGKHITDGRVRWDDCDHLSQGRYKESWEIALREGDVILSKDGTIGRVARIDALPGPATLNGTMMLLRPSPALAYRFLYHLLGGWAFRKLVNDKVSGSSVPHIFQRDMVTLPVRLPPLPEQRQIAEIIDTLDEAIRKTEAIIAKLKQVKQGLLHDLLTRGFDDNGELRDPERHPDQFKDSWLGRIPKQWSVYTLDELTSEPVTYGIVQAGPHVPGGIPYIRTGDMSGDRLTVDALMRTSPRIAASYRRSRVAVGEIVCAIRATVGKVLPVPPELDGANLTQGTARISPRTDANRGYVLWALRSAKAQRQFDLAVKGTTFREITLGQLRLLRLPLPGRSEQDAIAKVMRGLDLRLQRETTGVRKLRLLKQGLMEDLLTGRVRVTNLLEEAAE